MPFPAVPSQVRCPNCKTPFMVDVHTIIDVGQEPELKEQFLRGELNRAVCPQCGTGGLLSTPIIYHDPAKSLLVTYVPAELGLKAEEQERTVGSLVNALMNALPAEERKAYLFQPKTALSYESLMEMVLEAEGFTREMQQLQRARLNLIDDLLAAMDDDEAFEKLADSNLDKMDYEFFLLLAELIDLQTEHSESGGAPRLVELRDRLLNRRTAAMPGATAGLESPAELIDLLLSSQGQPQWDDLVAAYLPQMDYAFFQELTSRIEAAEASEDKAAAESLLHLRTSLLDALDRKSQELRDAEDAASLLIMELLEADDLEAALHQKESELDDVFFMVLARLRQAALARKNEQRAQRLTQLLDKARDVRESRLPPELRLVSRLLRADYPDGSSRLLDESADLVQESLLATYDRYVAQLGDGISPEAKERLAHIREQLVARVEREDA